MREKARGVTRRARGHLSSQPQGVPNRNAAIDQPEQIPQPEPPGPNMEIPERIEAKDGGDMILGHQIRYRVASGLLSPGDVVLDVACGIGYGALLLNQRKDVEYHGVDVITHFLEDSREYGTFYSSAIEEWKPTFDIDVAVCFETIEHLVDYEPLLTLIGSARKYVIASVPIIPTVGINPYHVHDFEPGDLGRLLGPPWILIQTLGQPSEVSEICIWERRD